MFICYNARNGSIRVWADFEAYGRYASEVEKLFIYLTIIKANY